MIFMKIYSFITAIAISILLTSCTHDDNEVITKQSNTIQKTDHNEIFSREADSISIEADSISIKGDPYPPKPKG